MDSQISLEQNAPQHLHQLTPAYHRKNTYLVLMAPAHQRRTDCWLGEKHQGTMTSQQQHQHTHVALSSSLNTHTTTDNDMAVTSSTRGTNRAGAEQHSSTA
jgi:hypothetical protein